MKVLITGINGFVGSNFSRKWNGKYILYGLDINPILNAGVEKIFAWEQLKDIPHTDAIIHLAGKAHDTKDSSLADSYFEINTCLTQKVFDYFLQSEARTFIFFSSVKAAADTVEGDILTEEIIPKPVGPYGESKIKAEEYILTRSRELKIGNKRIFILRPAMIYGPGNKGNLNLLYNVVRKGIPWPLGAYENKRSFCSVNNIAYVVEQLVVRENIESGIYHMCDDEALSTNELIRLIATSLGKKAHIWKFPRNMVNVLAGIGSVLHLPLNRERLKKLTENYVVSNEKIKHALNIAQLPDSLPEGLMRTFDSFRK